MAHLVWIAPVLLLAGVGLLQLSRGRRTERGGRIVLLALGGSAIILLGLMGLSLHRFLHVARRPAPAAVTKPSNCDAPSAQPPSARQTANSSPPDFVTFAACGPGGAPQPAGKGR